METSGYFIALVGKLCPGMELRQDDFRRGNTLCLVNVHGNAATVIFHDNAVVDANSDDNAVTVSRRCLVNAVVNDLVDQVMKAVLSRASNIHCRSLPDRFQTLQHLDAVSAVILAFVSLYYFSVRIFLHCKPASQLPQDYSEMPSILYS